MPMLDAAAAPCTALTSALSVERISNWPELENFAADWNQLAANFLPSSYFVTWDWLNCWWKAHGHSFELFVLLCRSEDGKLMGVAPLYRAGISKGGLETRSLRLLGDGTDD